MAEALDGIASDVGQISDRIRELERRVSALEGHLVMATPAASTLGIVARPASPPPEHVPPAATLSAGALPVVGKAVLGIAGAYLLRAVAESGTVPKLPVQMVAIVYAGMWLVYAVRTHATNYFASITYAITSALILSPLLWESTVRFHILRPAFAAAVLVAFVVLALVVTWRQNLQVIPWVATLTVEATALALIIATRDLVPFTIALLAVALAAEAAVCLGHRLTLRAVPAIAADFAGWLLVYVMTSPEGVPSDYQPVGATTITVLCLALLAVYGGSIGLRSFVMCRQLTIFEIAQGIGVFVLAIFGTLRASSASAPAIGAFLLLVAAVCYWGALLRFTADEQTRNRRVYATYAAALLLVGSFMLLSTNFQVLCLCLAAVAAVFLYSRTRKLSLGIHTSLFLAAAAVASPLVNYTANALAGTVPANPGLPVWVVACAAALCYAIGSRVSEDHWKRRLLWVVPAVLFSFLAAALAIVAMAWLASGHVELTASRLAVVRTLVTCLLALGLGFWGSRSTRVELSWVAYAAVTFGTLKLLWEDLRFGNAGSLVVSLLFYGLTLIVIPRLTRLGPTER